MKPENLSEWIKSIKLKKKPDLYLGALLFALTHAEERNILIEFSEKEQEIAWKSLTLLPREATQVMIDFATSQNILDIFNETYITIDEVFRKLERQGFVLDSWTKKNMIASLLDLLSESNFLEKKVEKKQMFKLSNKKKLDTLLDEDEIEFIREYFGGSTDFLKKCIKYSRKFLRGEKHFIDFGDESGNVWERYLDSYEWKLGRKFAVNSMQINNNSKYKMLNLCYGRGHELEELSMACPKIKVYALDFTDAYAQQAKIRIKKMQNKLDTSLQDVEFIESDKWVTAEKKGFGAPLPFQNNFFNGVILTFSDPFIPLEERFNTYSEIYRILKPNGVLGMLSWQYPDTNRVYYKDSWIRRMIYRHNFAESVVEGWYGFHDVYETLNMFKEVGFHYGGFRSKRYHLFDGIFWRMRK